MTLAAIGEQFSPGTAFTAKILGRGAIEATANGATVVLSDGRRLLDFGSYGVTLVGHRHPTVRAAVSCALEEGMPTATRILANPTTTNFASQLLQRCGEPLHRVWLGSDGSDVVEAALKLARRVTGRMRVLAVEGAFHGKTLGALALTTNPAFRAGLESLLGSVSVLPREDCDAVRREIDRGDVAALIFEPIQGEAGVRVLDPMVLRRWTSDARDNGIFVISDEVQVGLGRSGPFSPSVADGLNPDAVLLGKSLGGGLMPLAALVMTNALAAPLIVDPTWHTTTFSGHPLACAAGTAALTVIEESAANGVLIGKMLGTGLADLAREHVDVIYELRGTGLIWGLEFVTPGAAGAALIELAHRGLLVSPCLSSNRTIRLLPPAVTSPAQIADALAILNVTLPLLRSYL